MASHQSLTGLIKSTKGHLTEIIISCERVDSERVIQAIYQNCPKLKYLKFCQPNNSIFSEFENY